MLHTVAVKNYRSLRNVVVPLGQVTIVTGANGTGKSSLYRVLRLLHDNAHGRLVRSLAREGGITGAMWAGPSAMVKSVLEGEHPVTGVRTKDPSRLLLGFSSDVYGYSIDLGFNPPDTRSPFNLDPVIKKEVVWLGGHPQDSMMMARRKGGRVEARDRDGRMRELEPGIRDNESMLTEVADPLAAPEVQMLRDSIRDWRFYDHVRTDPDAPARRPHIGTYTPVLASDGGDLAAAIATIRYVGDHEGFDAAIEDGFPGARIEIVQEGQQFSVLMHQHGLLRPLGVAELSEGTLRYLLWVAALFTPRPPPLMVLNEPETSLHPDLLEPLARLIAFASVQMQIWVVSHHPRLVDALARELEVVAIRLDKHFGATRVESSTPIPRWSWPAR